MKILGRHRQLQNVALALLVPLAGPAGADPSPPSYDETHRPQLHFSPPTMWMNDPNGLVYYDGEFHLFYQYFPDAPVWGPMHWGHAVSRDLVSWQHLPVALYPDDAGYIFSGSAVADAADTSGLGRNGTAPLVAIFTYHDPVRAAAGTGDHESQGIAYSNDRGRTWSKYPDNPVLPNPGGRKDFRDPKVFWYAPDRRWIMLLSATDHVQLYASPDLKSWTHLSDFGRQWGAHGGTWECPDLFPLAAAGGGQRWVLLLNLNPGGPQGGSGTQYFLGSFDGRRFELDSEFEGSLRTKGAVWLDHGRDNYAGVTWSDVPRADGRRIFIGWMSNWDYAQAVPTAPWRSAMTLPRTLKLGATRAGVRLLAEPVRELAELRRESVEIHELDVDGAVDLSDRVDFPVAVSELLLEFERPADDVAIGVELSNGKGERYRVGYDGGRDDFFSDRTKAGDDAFAAGFADRVHRAPRMVDDGPVRLHLWFDVASAELFADGGATVMTDIFFPTEPYTRISLYSTGGKATIGRARITRLRSIW